MLHRRIFMGFVSSLCLLLAGCTVQYELANLVTAAPVISPGSNLFTSSIEVSISDSTQGAVIHYTTDGSIPSSSSSIYTVPFSVSQPTTVQAMAIAPSYQASNVSNEIYAFQILTPSISPASGVYSSPVSVAISDVTPGAVIYYTTDGSTPTSGSLRYSGALTVAVPETVQAIATGPTFLNSAVATAQYQFQVQQPIFSPAPGSYPSPISVTLSDPTPGAVLYYTTDGSVPTRASSTYGSPITVTQATTITAFASATGYLDSSVVSGTYSTTPGEYQWTWMGGPQAVGLPAVYGMVGVPAATNTPGTRGGSLVAGDSSGALWLFGGGTNAGYLNDLWRLDPITLQWTWVSGTNQLDDPGMYETKGVPGGTPPARSGGGAWTDAMGNVWIFGGATMNSANSQNILNDLWEFDVATKQWIWIGGSNKPNSGVSTTPPQPGNIFSPAYCKDDQGNFWLFGGNQDTPPFPDAETVRQLWEFSPVTQKWTYVDVSGTFNDIGSYGTQRLASASNHPGARSDSACWSDRSGNIWIFGGSGNDSGQDAPAADPFLNDLWMFNPSTKEWTWEAGSNLFLAQGDYGTRGVEAPTNVPSPRVSTTGWTDAQGNLWLFGGQTIDANHSYGSGSNDLWRYSPITGNWTWMAGSSLDNAPNSYGILGVPSATATPGGRIQPIGWAGSNGDLWLYGGGSSSGDQTDVWRYEP